MAPETLRTFKVMRRAPIVAMALLFAGAPGLLNAAPSGEVILISGGVSLHQWEQYKSDPHDKWWMNFVRAARLRIQEIRKEDPKARITWLVYKPAYVRRAGQEQKQLLPLIDSVRDTYKVRRVYFSKTSELLDYLNRGQNRARVKITDLEYFGHSNKACWMFDYSNYIDSASKAWLHEEDLNKLRPGIFTKDAYARSWGCHTGESMSGHFRKATGVPMWGAEGKTQYRTEQLPALSSKAGRWVQ